jgi:hypothetical protein
MKLKVNPIAVASLIVLVCCTVQSARSQDLDREPAQTRHILFVGDSFTHGRYLPVRTYHNIPGTGGIGSTKPSAYVVDENYGTNVTARTESTPGEYGPWGGIPGIFAELAHEANLPYDVHIEAISATTLAENYDAARDVIAQPLWNSVVLQEESFEPISATLSQNPKSNPQAFCGAVATIERAVHEVAWQADIYLYSTWAPADTAYLDATADGQAFSDDNFRQFLDSLTVAYRDAYISAAHHDEHIRDIAPVGDAWALAWREGIANPDPYAGSAPGVALSFGYRAGSEPSTKDVPTDAGFHHPSQYGAYLNALVLFETITKTDVRMFGAREQAAEDLGISGQIAVALQQVAWEAGEARRNKDNEIKSDPCASSN